MIEYIVIGIGIFLLYSLVSFWIITTVKVFRDLDNDSNVNILTIGDIWHYAFFGLGYLVALGIIEVLEYKVIK